MKRIRFVIALSLVVSFAVAPPVPAQCPPYVSSTYTYFSDFFVTAVGGYTYACDDSYSEWGTLDGPYVEWRWIGCCGGGGTGRRCYSNNNGTWTQITCP